jgi:hypothetical protein
MGDLSDDELQRIISIAIAMQRTNEEAHEANPTVIQAIAQRAQTDQSNIDLVREIAQGANVNVAFAEVALQVVRPHNLHVIADELTHVTGEHLMGHLKDKLLQEIDTHILPIVKQYYPDASFEANSYFRSGTATIYTMRYEEEEVGFWKPRMEKVSRGLRPLVQANVHFEGEPVIQIHLYEPALLTPCRTILEQFKQKYLPHYRNFIVKLV